MNAHPYARLNTFHGPKRQLLGNHAGHAAPAWKNVPVQGPSSVGKGKQVQLDPGSKIFLSRLPLDVKDSEVEVRFVSCAATTHSPTNRSYFEKR